MSRPLVAFLIILFLTPYSFADSSRQQVYTSSGHATGMYVGSTPSQQPYQAQSYASSAVGTPGVDFSGQQAANSISNAANQALLFNALSSRRTETSDTSWILDFEENQSWTTVDESTKYLIQKNETSFRVLVKSKKTSLLNSGWLSFSPDADYVVKKCRLIGYQIFKNNGLFINPEEFKITSFVDPYRGTSCALLIYEYNSSLKANNENN